MLKRTYSVAYLAGVVYFVQGFLGIAGVTLPLFLRSLNWSITDITTISSMAAAPWVVKILYGLLSDCFPAFGYRRKSYLILFSVLAGLGWLTLVICPPEKHWILAALLMANLGFAATDVVTDGLIVEHSAKHASAFYQSVAWGSRSFGAFLSGFIGGWLAEQWRHERPIGGLSSLQWIGGGALGHWRPQHVFFLTALLPLLVMGCSFLIRERQMKSLPFRTALEPLKRCVGLFKNSNLQCFVAILVISAIGSSFGIPFFFFMKESLGFKETFLGLLSSVGWGGAMVGSLVYVRWLRKVSQKKLLQWAITINAVNILSTLLISDTRSAFVLVFVGGIMGCLTMLPMMTASAVLTHHSGVEGTLFAVLMSLYNLGQIAFGFIGGRVFPLIGLQPLILITGVLALSGLFFVSRLKI